MFKTTIYLNKSAALIGYIRALLFYWLTPCVFFTACSHNLGGNDEGAKSQPLSNKSAQLAPSVTISQIGDTSKTLSTPQINTLNKDNQILSIEQLRNFSDRCQSGNSTPPPQGLDCSEINLRMQRLLNADDSIINALLTLGQLGRADNLSRTIDDLNNGQSGQTLIGGAIAGGLINEPPPSAPPLEPSPELEQFLQDNGLIINQVLNSQRP